MDDTRQGVLEQLLILRCQAGDERAFAQLVAGFDASLRYYVGRLLAYRRQVDDLMQEVWLAAYQGLPRLKDPSAFRGWVYSIARNKAFEELRRANRWPMGAEHPLEPQDAEETPAEAGEEFTPEDAAQIHSCLERLSPEHRDVLLLRFLQEMSYEEIAATTGCQVGTVRSRLHHAKRAMRRELERIQS